MAASAGGAACRHSGSMRQARGRAGREAAGLMAAAQVMAVPEVWRGDGLTACCLVCNWPDPRARSRVALPRSFFPLVTGGVWSVPKHTSVLSIVHA